MSDWATALFSAVATLAGAVDAGELVRVALVGLPAAALGYAVGRLRPPATAARPGPSGRSLASRLRGRRNVEALRSLSSVEVDRKTPAGGGSS